MSKSGITLPLKFRVSTDLCLGNQDVDPVWIVGVVELTLNRMSLSLIWVSLVWVCCVLPSTILLVISIGIGTLAKKSYQMGSYDHLPSPGAYSFVGRIFGRLVRPDFKMSAIRQRFALCHAYRRCVSLDFINAPLVNFVIEAVRCDVLRTAGGQ